MEAIFDILIKLAGTLVGVGMAWLAKSAGQYLRYKFDQEKLDKFITSAVAAAEQQFKAEDDDGKRRFTYVEGLLIEAGYDITEAIQAMIESKVYALNMAARKQ